MNVDIAKLCQTGWDSSYLGRAHARQRRLTADIRNAVSDRASTLHCPISLWDVRAGAISLPANPQNAVASRRRSDVRLGLGLIGQVGSAHGPRRPAHGGGDWGVMRSVRQAYATVRLRDAFRWVVEAWLRPAEGL